MAAPVVMVDGQPQHGIEAGLVPGASPPRLQEALSFPRRGVLVRPCLIVTTEMPSVPDEIDQLHRSAEVLLRLQLLFRERKCARTSAASKLGVCTVRTVSDVLTPLRSLTKR